MDKNDKHRRTEYPSTILEMKNNFSFLENLIIYSWQARIFRLFDLEKNERSEACLNPTKWILHLSASANSSRLPFSNLLLKQAKKRQSRYLSGDIRRVHVSHYYCYCSRMSSGFMATTARQGVYNIK
ncbi:hypothetical protein CEXT_59121 [Caerostris extrusa]|uniref:Uncharacterized protein n=1 Tax=Caerostris extrusa TaxID=172846 RepID=A0AAV4U5M5_CAEEX|nr:hypothetical protein CEXT_59121 [Caerostris extrusa]